MAIKWKNYLIKSYDYGYVAQKRVGNQWKAIGYYRDLKQAVKDLFEHRVLTETANCIVDAQNTAAIRLQSAHILQRIEEIADDIGKGLHNDTERVQYHSRDLSRV